MPNRAHAEPEEAKIRGPEVLATWLHVIGHERSKMRLRETDFLTIAVKSLRIQ